MTGSYCMPIGGNFTPPVIYPQDKNNHHLLGSALLGGAAGYGAYKLNLDIIKDSMSASAFEDAIRTGKDPEFKPSLTAAERKALDKAKVDSVVFSDSEIGNIFASEERLSYHSYLRQRYGGDITTKEQLQRAIDKRSAGPETHKDSNITQEQKIKSRIGYADTLKGKSSRLSELEQKIVGLNSQIAELQLKVDTSLTEEARNRKIHALQAQRKAFGNERKVVIKDIKDLMGESKGNITKDTVKAITADNGEACYKSVQDLHKALEQDLGQHVTSPTAIEQTSRLRESFFEQHFNDTIAKHEDLLQKLAPATSNNAGLTRMQADLKVVEAAERNGGFITREMLTEIRPEIGAELGKGTGSIEKAFGMLKNKLPKELGSWKKAGLLGGVVALGLYCFNNQ